MSQRLGTTEVESVLNSVAGVQQARVRSFARNDDGTLTFEVEVAPGDSPVQEAPARESTSAQAAAEAPDSPDSGSETAESGSLEALAREAQAQQAGDAREAGGENAGGEYDCEVCDRSFASANARNGHMAAHANREGRDGGSETPDSGGSDPETPVEYIRAFGPCVAAGDADGREPCGYGANGADARFCPRHARMDSPALSVRAVEAAQAHESGDSEAVEAFIAEHA